MMERAGALRQMSEHPALARTLHGRLEARRAEMNEQVANGLAQDWADYKYRIGVIRGLSDAILLCLEVEKELD